MWWSSLSKSTFVNDAIIIGFYVINRFLDNAYLSYLTNGKPSSEKSIQDYMMEK